MDDLEILRDAMLTIGIDPMAIHRTARGNAFPLCDWPLSTESHRCLTIEWIPRSRDYRQGFARSRGGWRGAGDYWVNALLSSSTEYAVKEGYEPPPILWLGPFAPWPHKCRSKSSLQIAALASIYLSPRDPTIHVWDGRDIMLCRLIGQRAWERSDMVACPFCLSMLFPPEGWAE